MMKKIIKKLIFYLAPFLLPKSKANLFIVGGQKCGTSSLHSTLIKSKDINGSFMKEVHYFEKNYFLGKFWYNGFFYFSRFKKVTYNIESSPNYIMYDYALKRIKQYNPNSKIIFVVRSRLDRAYSHYRHNLRFRSKEENFSFNDALKNESNRLKKIKNSSKNYSVNRDKFNYIERSLYYNQILSLYNIFERDKIIILEFDKLFKGSDDKEWKRLFKFLDIKFKNFQIAEKMINNKIHGESKNFHKNLFNEYFEDDYKKCKKYFNLETK